MTWKNAVNRTLARTTGLELHRAGSVPPRRRKNDRLVTEPAFVMCSIRSGSTLLRVMLNSHSQIHSPHEIHLRDIHAEVHGKWAPKTLRAMKLDQQGLDFLLWDRILDRELVGSRKRHLVTKTPNDVFIADQIKECWPDAKMIFLIRHPAMIAKSRKRLRPQADDDKNVELILRYCTALEAARQKFDGPTIRYEDLTTDPAGTLKIVCEHLGVEFEPSMLDYGQKNHGKFKAGLGDWNDKIKTGKVQPPAPLPTLEEIPEPLRDMCRTWGYLP